MPTLTKTLYGDLWQADACIGRQARDVVAYPESLEIGSGVLEGQQRGPIQKGGAGAVMRGRTA
jgi:hypothetical protein